MPDPLPTSVAFDVHGPDDGPTVVLLHSLALDRSVWDAHLPDLAADHRVVRCDLPGHGASAPIRDLTVWQMAERVAEALDHAGTDRAVVAGLSLGGCVAQALAVQDPDRVTGVVLADTTAWYGPDAPEQWAARAAKARAEGLPSLADFQLVRWFNPTFRAANRDVCDRLLEVFAATELGSYETTCHAMGAFDARDRLGEIAVPAAVIVGEDDPATPVSHAEALAAGIAGTELEVVPGCGHLSPIERPDVLVRTVRDLGRRVAER